jgi:hypothetical protein
MEKYLNIIEKMVKNTQYQLISKGPQISTGHTQLLLHWWTFGNQTKFSKSSISPRFKQIPKIHKPKICHTTKTNPKTNLTKTLPSNYQFKDHKSIH